VRWNGGTERARGIVANHQRGFEFLRRSAIDQHVDTRNRWDHLIPVIQKFPTLLVSRISDSSHNSRAGHPG
jgi:cyanophycinase-like exopeptidase